MSELVAQLAARAGLDGGLANQTLSKKVALSKKEVSSKSELPPQTAASAQQALTKKAVGKNTAAIILGRLRNETATYKIQALINEIPDADASIKASGGGGRRVGLLGCGLIAPGGKLIGLDRSMDEIRSGIGELFNFGRDRVAANRMGKTIAGTLRFPQFAFGRRQFA
jgi:hypothetical protein